MGMKFTLGVIVLLSSIVFWQTLQLSESKDRLDMLNQTYQQHIEQLNFELEAQRKLTEEIQQKYEATKDELMEILAEAPEGFEVAKVMTDFQVTWYNYNSGATFTGVPPEEGVTVAVDPNVVELGSWVKIVMPDGTEYIRKAQDTGGAVKGKIIDIYSTASTSELLKRGRTHNVEVYLLKAKGGES